MELYVLCNKLLPQQQSVSIVWSAAPRLLSLSSERVRPAILRQADITIAFDNLRAKSVNVGNSMNECFWREVL